MSRHSSAQSFGLSLKRGYARIEEVGVRILSGLTIKVWGLALVATCVDTGLARQGWAAAVGAVGTEAPRPGVYPEMQADLVAPPPPPPQLLSTLANAPLGVSRYVYNNVEYIVWLEIGTERRAGDYMLKSAVETVRNLGLAA